MNRFVACLLLALAAVPSVPAQSTKWPAKPVRVIVPFPAGGTTDVVARTLAPRLSEEYGQQFIVDNRVGAPGTIGAELAARAQPDGYTIAVVTSRFPEVQERLPASGGEPAPSTPDGFAQVIARDIATWSTVIREGNIKLN